MTDVLTEDALFELLSLEFRIDREGTVYYYNALGQLHRIHGPAVVCTDGYYAWYRNGQRHRLGGPAVVYSDGSTTWWQDGRLHRLGGPAIERVDGSKFWYINGDWLTETEWQQQVASMETV